MTNRKTPKVTLKRPGKLTYLPIYFGGLVFAGAMIIAFMQVFAPIEYDPTPTPYPILTVAPTATSTTLPTETENSNQPPTPSLSPPPRPTRDINE